MRMNKSTLLASAVALASTVYLPTASALSDTFDVNAAGTYFANSASAGFTDTGGYGSINSFLTAAITAPNAGVFDLTIDLLAPLTVSGDSTWNLAFDSALLNNGAGPGTVFSNIQYSYNGGTWVSAPNVNGAFDVNSNAIPGVTPIGVAFTGPTSLEIKGTESLNAGTSGDYQVVITSGNLSSVPEPALLSMMLLGLPLIAGFARRKQVA